MLLTLTECYRRSVDKHRDVQETVQHEKVAGKRADPFAEPKLQVGIAGRCLQFVEHREENVHHEYGDDYAGDGAGPVLDAIAVHFRRDAQHRDGGDVTENVGNG